jgi:hypothetical protein
MAERKTELSPLMHELSWHAGEDLRQQKGLPNDQSNGNRCDVLTYSVMEALQFRGLPIRRELHTDEYKNWHYLLAHALPDTEPSYYDVVTDLNPWQWRAQGGPIIHGTREEVMEKMRFTGAPDFVVALRGLETIYKPHDLQIQTIIIEV